MKKLFALVSSRSCRLWFEARDDETPIELYKRMREEFPNSTVYIIRGEYMPV